MELINVINNLQIGLGKIVINQYKIIIYYLHFYCAINVSNMLKDGQEMVICKKLGVGSKLLMGILFVFIQALRTEK